MGELIKLLLCCKIKSLSVIICIPSGTVFCQSCVRRNWTDKVVLVDKTRVKCVEHTQCLEPGKNFFTLSSCSRITEQIQISIILEVKLNEQFLTGEKSNKSKRPEVQAGPVS